MKKLDGGICFGSPTTITFLPLAIAPIDSHVGIWEASSKITRSNFAFSTSKYCATEIGLISIHGHNLGSRLGVKSNNLLIDIARPLFLIARWSTPISELFDASSVKEGIFEASLANNSALVSSSKYLLCSLNFLIFPSNNFPLNMDNRWSFEIMYSDKLLNSDFLNAAKTSWFSIFPFEYASTTKLSPISLVSSFIRFQLVQFLNISRFANHFFALCLQYSVQSFELSCFVSKSIFNKSVSFSSISFCSLAIDINSVTIFPFEVRNVWLPS